MNNKTEFTYSPTGGRVKIVETVSGSVTSTKQFIGGEERDGGGSVTKRLFSQGKIEGASNYFYSRDHLTSIRTMTDNSGAIVSDRVFDPSGRVNTLSETLAPDFGFAGMYLHSRSTIYLTASRGYSPSLGRWISRDPIEEEGGVNLFAYAGNDSIGSIDPLGLFFEGNYYVSPHWLIGVDPDSGQFFASNDIFSGTDFPGIVNNSLFEQVGGQGPITRGDYFILAGEQRAGAYEFPLMNLQDIKRGGFRLHAGLRSGGCVTFRSRVGRKNPAYPTNPDFDKLRNILDHTTPIWLPTGQQVVGILHVR